MVDTTLTYIHKLLRQLEKFLIEKNGFQLSGETYDLILLIPSDRYSTDIKYSLVVSAKTLNHFHQKEVIKALLTYFKETLDNNEYNSITRINVINTEDPLVKNLKMMFGFREEAFELNDITIAGIRINFAYLIKSLILDKLIEGRALKLQIMDPEGNISDISAGIIRIERDFSIVYYTGKGLRELWKPDMSNEEKKHAQAIKNLPEHDLIENHFVSRKRLDDILKVI
jgi:hypothetical protein